MVEFLVMAQDVDGYEDSKSNAAKCPRKGDIVAVFEAGHTWGRLECPPRFCVVKSDLKIDDARLLIGASIDKADAEKKDAVLAFAKTKIEIDKMTAAEKVDLADGKAVEITKDKQATMITAKAVAAAGGK
jgi:hypothetical protein